MTQPAAPIDDLAAAFQIEGWPVRGRLVRLGAAVDQVLSAHDYPEPVAGLLGEACALAAASITDESSASSMALRWPTRRGSVQEEEPSRLAPIRA